jgi:signal transduction histidine kinase/DNA-binding response OmpR family regulator
MTTPISNVRFKRRRPWLLGVTILVALAAGLWMRHRYLDPSRATTPFRIGFQYSPPHQYVSKDGQPQGPAVEVLTESARRRHIPIEWVLAPEGPEPAIASGKVDLWPVVGDMPERRKLMYISEPWMTNSVYMVTLQSSAIFKPEDAVGHSVSNGGSNLDVRLAARDFGRSQTITAKSAGDGLELMCEGRADAAMASSNNIRQSLRSSLSCQDSKLRFYPLADGRLNSGIAASRSRRGAKEAADALREGITDLANDGLFSSAYYRWSSDLNNDSMVIGLMNETRRWNRYMAAGLTLLGLAFGLLALLANRLRALRRSADDANLSKSWFLANMSHEIRTPMNGILGMTELAIDTESREEQREYLEMAKLSGNALLTIINDILDFSKMEAGKLALDPIPFALRDTLLHSLRSVALRAHQKSLELTCEIAPDVPDVLIGDPDRLRQIVVNLAGNALKFTEQGEVCLEARLLTLAPLGKQRDALWGAAANSPRPAFRAQLQFTVRDTGIGIAKERQEAVFAAFSQADGSTTRRHGGTGLGLAICKNLVKMMGGKMWLESQPGSGTSVHFTADFQAAAPKIDSIRDARNQALVGRRALIVDNNATNRRILTAFCERHGLAATTAASGAEAVSLAVASDPPFDLLLLDLQMPHMDGFETLARIRQGRPDFRSPVIAFGSIGYSCDAARREALGISASFTKPVLHADLLRTMQELFAATVANGGRAASDAGHAARASEAGASEAGCRGPLAILVAEDNSVNQTLVRRLLTRRGHQVTVVGNGRAALEEFQRQHFDLILMDVQMPEMDGLTASLEIRALESREHRPRTPIVALTANAMTGDRATCLAAGMDGYVSKPIRNADLFAVIGDVCAAREPVPVR